MPIYSSGYYINHLQLTSHPEGGYYKETYRCEDSLQTESGSRNISTAIYFLLDGKNKSHFHRIKSDELWFFHDGNTLEILVLDNKGLRSIYLGKNLEDGEKLQAIIPAGSWFGARVKDGNGFALVSCTVAPGFDFNDFELATNSLSQLFPEHKELIKEMTL